MKALNADNYVETPDVDLIRVLNDVAIITETDLQGRITFVNEQFCQISGYSKEELLGSTHQIVNSGTHSKAFFSNMWQTICSGNVWFGEVCNQKKLGELYWLQAIIMPIFKGEGADRAIGKYVAIRFDITQQKREEVALKDRAALYQAVTEVTDGFCRIDCYGQILEVSDGYCKLTKYKQNDLLNMNIADFDASTDSNERKEHFKQIMKGDGKTFEIERVRQDYSTWTAEITATPTPTDNGELFVFLHDITERKKLEKSNHLLELQVNHMQKLDSIGRLTAGIAHDFNNILTSILGYTELSKIILDDGLFVEDSVTVLERNLAQIEIAANRAAEIIAQMMTYCRQGTVVKKALSDTKLTRPLIIQVVDMVRVGLTDAFKIETVLDDTLDIVAESSELHQVLMNLLINARDAMKKKGGGIIKVRLSTVELPECLCRACLATMGGEFIELSVSDSGTGIDEDVMTKIFDPFFTTKGVGEGTGLGLSMVSGIVHRSGGHILVESELNVGTTFRLFFPVILWDDAEL